MTVYSASTLEEILAAAAEEKNCAVEALQYNVVETTEEGVTAEVFNMEDVKEFIFDYLGNFFMGIDCDLECAIEEKQDQLIVNLNAENNAVLIGKMGKTIAALNTVLRAAVNAEFKKHLDILVDVNGYKADRYRKISSLARRVGKQVQRSKVAVELDPMPNDERKVIHKALSNWHNLLTESEGDGAERHVVIKYVTDETPTEEAE